jgi:hypothetical protein
MSWDEAFASHYDEWSVHQVPPLHPSAEPTRWAAGTAESIESIPN